MRISDWSSDVCSSDLKGPRSARLRGDDDDLYPIVRGSQLRFSGGARGCGAVGDPGVPDGVHLGEIRHIGEPDRRAEIGRAHVCTPVTNAHLVCRLLLEKKKRNKSQNTHTHNITLHNKAKHTSNTQQTPLRTIDSPT